MGGLLFLYLASTLSLVKKYPTNTVDLVIDLKFGLKQNFQFLSCNETNILIHNEMW
jgi:hypothetical protein